MGIVWVFGGDMVCVCVCVCTVYFFGVLSDLFFTYVKRLTFLLEFLKLSIPISTANPKKVVITPVKFAIISHELHLINKCGMKLKTSQDEI